MLTVPDAVLRSWPFDPWLWVGLLTVAGCYLRGWRILRRRGPDRWPVTTALAFLGGLVTLFVALGSPLEPFTSLLLQAHMAQHLLLTMLAPPLLWLGAPWLPLVRGLPDRVRSTLIPILAWPFLHGLLRRLSYPPVALVAFVATIWIWHVPRLYELALADERWHYTQHACFLAAGLLFWYPVVRPYPARPTWSAWLLVPYLLLADVQNTALSALFTFADAPLYPHYEQVPRLGTGSVLDDQSAAGVLMWVPGSLAFLVPLGILGVRLLYGLPKQKPRPTTQRMALPLVDHRQVPETVDLLRMPLLGRFLRWRHARLAMQVPLLLAAVVLVVDGFLGPQVAPLNLAGVVPWIHWRGLLVLGLLAVGNVFCFACPFLLPRTLARRWLPTGRPWPLWLRNKWPAIALLLAFLWAYEALSLWDQPMATAGLILAYFALAFVVDGVYRHASFCKFVCPIGQFNFVQSLVSPFEVTVRDPAVCSGCRTKECIRGSEKAPGCELALFLPRKQGNMDCTFCMDCVHACPHDNTVLAARMPGEEIGQDPQRSGIGKFSARTDLAVLVVLFAFGAFTNAAGMIAPVVDWEDRLGELLGWSSRVVVTLFLLGGLLVVPGVLLTVCVLLTRWLDGKGEPLASIFRKFSYCLVPLAAAMWLAHHGFHFFTSHEALWPAAARAGSDLGWLHSAPDWVCTCCATVPGWLLRLEIVWLDLGLLLSLWVAWRLAARRWWIVLPWALLLVALFALGIWILVEPMQMRGAMAG